MGKAAAAKVDDRPPQREDKRQSVAKGGAQMCKVFDSGAKDAKREHLVNGHKYVLSAWEGEECLVPLEDAVIFLKEPQFAVYTMDGHRMRPHTTTSRDNKQKLAPHETIATYAELEKSALIRRAHQLPNGLLMTPATPKDTIISFLMAGGMQATVVEETDKDGKAAGKLAVTMEEDGGTDFADALLRQTAPGMRTQSESDGDGDLEDLGTD